MARTWLPVELALTTHRKTKHLARLWHCHPYTVVGFLVALWGYCLEFQSDGRLSDVPDEDLRELAAPCQASAIGTLPDVRDALRRCGFLDPDERLHDWEDYAGAIVTRRERDRARKRDQRHKSAGRPTDVSRTSAPTAQHSRVEHSTTPTAAAAAVAPKGASGAAAEDDVRTSVPEAYRSAYDGFLKAARNPVAVSATVRDCGPGGAQQVRGASWEHVGRALLEMQAAGDGTFSGSRLRGFIRRLVTEGTGRDGAKREPTGERPRKAHPFRTIEESAA